MQRHVEDFVRLSRFATGDSVVRRFTLHDLHNFSIEQRIFIEVIYRTNTWSSEFGIRQNLCLDTNGVLQFLYGSIQGMT